MGGRDGSCTARPCQAQYLGDHTDPGVLCRGLDEQTLNATVPGTYGTIIATLRHIIYCERDFLDRLLGREPSDPWQLGETTGLGVLTEHAALLATDWEAFLASDVDSERPLPPDE